MVPSKRHGASGDPNVHSRLAKEHGERITSPLGDRIETHGPMRQKYRKLPEALRPLFWNQVFHRLSWKTDCDLVTARILEYGGWDAVCWLWRRLGDEGLREWLV